MYGAVISPQTFAEGQGLGNGKVCWRRVTFWAAASLTNHWVAGGAAGSPPFVRPPLPAAGKHTAHHRSTPTVIGSERKGAGERQGCSA